MARGWDLDKVLGWLVSTPILFGEPLEEWNKMLGDFDVILARTAEDDLIVPFLQAVIGDVAPIVAAWRDGKPVQQAEHDALTRTCITHGWQLANAEGGLALDRLLPSARK